MSRPAITLRDLTVRYPRAERPALYQLSLQVSPGETVLLLGPSGGGKSTLGRVLAGLIPHNVYARVHGGVQVGDLDLLEARPGQIAAQVGLLFQDPEAGFATLVVEDEIAFGLENLRVAPAKMPARIQATLEAVDLVGYRLRRLETLSGGEAQRVALASLLAMSPPVLVLDEPTANLDPRAAGDFFETLAALRGEHTILLIEHNLDACMHLADRVVLLTHDGGLLAEGDPQTVYRNYMREIEEACIWIPESFRQETSQKATRRRAEPELDGKDTRAVVMENITFAYADRSPVLKKLDFSILNGDFVALVGANGSGKSTLARLIMGLLPRPQGGETNLFGRPIDALSLAELTERVGYVFQNPEHQFVTDTVWDELAYSLRARRWPDSKIARRVEDLLDRFKLALHANQNPFTLSQGQKRRLSVATMLAAGQRLLILDEPTFGQDRCTAEALMDSLIDLNDQGVTILMITHDMRLVRDYARRTAVLTEGQIVFNGPPVQLFARQELLREARLR